MIYKLFNNRIVVKFGGSSVRFSFRETLELVKSLCEGNKVVVVLSALKGVTDLLLDLSKSKNPELLEKFEEIHLELIERLGIDVNLESEFKELEFIIKNEKLFPSIDAYVSHVLSFGERLSVKIFSRSLEDHGINATAVDAFYLIKTNEDFSNAKVDLEKTGKNIWVIEELLKDSVPIVTGFLGNFNGFRTTLGRGGSDYTASVLGRLLNARAILIMSDVEGIYTADPRIVKDAKIVPFISYHEALIASRLGMKALHERAVEPIVGRVPIIFGKTSNRKLGSLVSHVSSKMPIITHKISEEMAKISIVGSPNVDVRWPIAERADNYVAFLVTRDELENALNELHEVVFNES
ncbi:aspartate kinase [Thermococcus sp. MV5]|uniref:aspartate kinase n=1 Tax=Thermococcus sp. MV5 TaxID=1638272 RepID=UPI00143A76A8|nr:aspartate kinase [Thermococcus sp. MV5]